LSEEGGRPDFFVSYTGVNEPWAKWIAVQLEKAGYHTVSQVLDFRPGHDFVHKMHYAITTAARTIAVLSPAYLDSTFGEAEWRGAFAEYSDGELGKLRPLQGHSHEDQYELDEFVRPPEPEVTDRATTAALLAAIGSSTVRDCHAVWRAAADVLTREVRLIHHGLSLEPVDGVSEEYLKPIRDEVLPKVQIARRALAEAIAQELGHRKRHRRRTELRQMERE
jgi:hypothetical protein